MPVRIGFATGGGATGVRAMAIGRFLISRDATGAFRWVLRDEAGGTVSESTGGFTEHKACTASIQQLRKLCAKAEVVDLTAPAMVIKPKAASRPAKKSRASTSGTKKAGGTIGGGRKR